jgi:hypothetical protein
MTSHEHAIFEWLIGNVRSEYGRSVQLTSSWT